ncbi:MAG: formate/nitrite transporter family protein [Muribaculaceae bacterium]|nr:formate/nitrite transporter family protein [Muribaculaceae bacterium]MDE6610009.1 formate/nitrite transporter family protein [Muribaculaceae bacterium]
MEKITRAFLAGVCIAIAGTAYLNVGGPTGMVMFAFGLIVVVAFKYLLFTGRSGYTWGEGYGGLALMLFWNLVGCIAVASVTGVGDVAAKSQDIIMARLASGPVRCGLMSIGCGFIMTAAVRGYNEHGTWLPLLFGVPAFIACGFPHCVADGYYLAASGLTFFLENLRAIVPFYCSIVVGNYLGCNLYRLAEPSMLRVVAKERSGI